MNMGVTTTQIVPLTLAEQTSLDEDSYVILNRLAYPKRAFYGSVIQIGEIFGVSDQRAMIVGIGKKQLKVLYVNEPPRGTLHGEDPHRKWSDNEEDFIDRSYADPLLGSPPMGEMNKYRTT